jgi:tubulin-specific chaperone A
MAPPSALHIATQSVKRLVKEEASYHKELVGQQARVDKLKADIQSNSPDLDENAEYVLKQEVSAGDVCSTSRAVLTVINDQETAMAETQNIFGPLRQRISEAVQRLEEQVAQSESGSSTSAEELKEAKEALAAGKQAAQGQA